MCSIGEELFKFTNSKEEYQQEFELFLRVWNMNMYKEIFGKEHQDDETMNDFVYNRGGNGMYHSFGIWMIIKKLLHEKEIDSYVESGVWKGNVAKMVRSIVGPDFPIVLLDPMDSSSKGASDDVWKPTGNVINKRGKNFSDFAKIDFHSLGINPSRALILFDDHMDQVNLPQVVDY